MHSADAQARQKASLLSCKTNATATAGQGHQQGLDQAQGQEHEQGHERAGPGARAHGGKSRGSSSSNGWALTNSQGHVDVMAQVLLQLELLAQGQVGGPAVHG